MTDSQLLPVLPLRDAVLFPGVTVPIGAGRPGTLKAIEQAIRSEAKEIFVVAQRRNEDDASPELLYTVGTVAKIGELQRGLGGIQLILHGLSRGIAVRFSRNEEGFIQAVVRPADDMLPLNPDDSAFVGLYREVRERAAELGKRAGLPDEVVARVLQSLEEPGRLSDVVAAYTEMQTAERQMLLETLAVEERLRRVLVQVQRQIGVLDAQETIKSQVQEELGDRQREIYLREQLKAIQRELGEGDEATDLEELREKLDALDLPDSARKEIDREWARLSRIGRESMESQVIRNFLETVTELPWNERSEEHLEIQGAQRILEEDHYGLEDVKDRVLEFLAVRQLREAERAKERAAAEAAAEAERAAAETAEGDGKAGEAEGEPGETEIAAAPETAETEEPTVVVEGSAEEEPDSEDAAPEEAAPEKAARGGEGAGGNGVEPEHGEDRGEGDGGSLRGNEDDRVAKGPILLFVGPPGVGKTSIAKSIARAMGREYVRISLGGARDEADIRGHRRTYVGAMPGRIVQGMKQAGKKNPVFLLDEIDKLGVSFQGDPASALLEVLDPAQNDSFTDHYLGVPFDLSEVLFVATANFIQNIPAPLLDRMETVEFTGYTEAEKLAIARQYLLPRQLRENSLSPERLAVSDDAVSEVIAGYTREAGVRQLERELGKLARKIARKIAAEEVERAVIDRGDVRELLGRPKVHPERAAAEDQVGVATGMYYTPVGGDIMFVEASTMAGKGELVLTGQLGEVMKESARAAWTYARSHADELGIDPEDFKRDLHVHVPAGSVPKEGPSAGVAMATALVSSLSGRPARHDIAMTGEITLSGRVLPIGGVKEKVLGAVRAGITTVVLPKQNEADLEDLTDEVRSQLDVHPVEELGEALALTLRGASLREGRLFFAEAVVPEDETAVLPGGVSH